MPKIRATIHRIFSWVINIFEGRELGSETELNPTHHSSTSLRNTIRWLSRRREKTTKLTNTVSRRDK